MLSASGSVANEKSHSDLVTSLTQASLFERHWRLMVLSGRKRGGRQWRLTELNGLMKGAGRWGDSVARRMTTGSSSREWLSVW